MEFDPNYKPHLRPVEAFRVPAEHGCSVGLRDRSGLSEMVLTLSEPVLQILALMDGEHSCAAILEQFEKDYGDSLTGDILDTLLKRLDEACFLEGVSFDQHYQKLLEDYRTSGIRTMRDAVELGITNGSGDLFDQMLSEAEKVELTGPIRGLVAPHLDYPRGRCGYAAAYATLRNRPVPQRVIVLGTNHFGRSTSVVTTANDFETPLGRTQTDRSLIDTLEAGCGSLRQYELDHLREHSIELQIAWLQHLFGASNFQVAAFLCPDPCGPTGTKPHDGDGVDLQDFAVALREVLDQDTQDTLILAGADLSHVGAAFGDDRELNDEYLAEVRRHDHKALEQLEKHGAESLRDCVAEANNRTNICSVGCIYALSTVLPDAQVTLLKYHQAVDLETQTCVTCAALAFC